MASRSFLLCTAYLAVAAFALDQRNLEALSGLDAVDALTDFTAGKNATVAKPVAPRPATEAKDEQVKPHEQVTMGASFMETKESKAQVKVSAEAKAAAKMKMKLQKAERAVKYLKQQNGALQTKVKSLSNDLALDHQKLQAVEQDSASKAASWAAEKKQLEESQSQSESRRLQLAALVNTEKQKQTKSAQEEKSFLQKAQEEHQQQLKLLQESLETTRQQKARVEAEVKSTVSEKDKLASTLKSVKAELHELKMSSREAATQSTIEAQKLEEERDQLSRQVEELKANVEGEHEHEHDLAVDEKKQLKIEKSEDVAAEKKVEAELAKKTQQVEQVKQILIVAQKKSKATAKTLETTQQERDAALLQVKEMTEEMEQMKKQMGADEDSKDRIKASLIKQHKANERLLGRLHELEKKAEDATDKSAKAEAHAADVDAKLSKRTSELKDAALKEMYAKVSNELKKEIFGATKEPSKES